MTPKPYTIGIAGPSGSGKSYFAAKIAETLRSRVLRLSMDDYYRDRSDIPLAQRGTINYDHPDAIDFDLLVNHVMELQKGCSINKPIYDFTVHTRRPKREKCLPADIILLDGILLFTEKRLHSLIDFKIYVDTPPDISLIRRIRRDTRERGRSVESVIRQYLATVRPMYLRYVLPGKKIANFVVVGEGSMQASLSHVIDTVSNDGA
jgi:uridine kinase